MSICNICYNEYKLNKKFIKCLNCNQEICNNCERNLIKLDNDNNLIKQCPFCKNSTIVKKSKSILYNLLVNINKTNKNLIEQVETLKYFILELDNEREFLRFQLS